MMQVYGILFAVVGLAVLVILLIALASRKRGEDVGELNQAAKDAIADIQAAVKSGDDAAVQAALLKHLKANTK